MAENSKPGPIVIAGGSGFLGISLASHLADLKHSIVILSRHPPKLTGPWRHVFWDARSLGEWNRELDGAIGSGSQGMSWIHETDMNRIFERALTDPDMHGPYIASSPHPVSQKVFMREIRRAIGMPIGLPAPAWLVRLAVHYIFRTDPELALYGRYVISKRLEEQQFAFRFPQLREALHDMIATRTDAQASSNV